MVSRGGVTRSEAEPRKDQNPPTMEKASPVMGCPASGWPMVPEMGNWLPLLKLALTPPPPETLHQFKVGWAEQVKNAAAKKKPSPPSLSVFLRFIMPAA